MKLIYENLTSPEIGRWAQEVVAVLPVAAIEQHGDHLPVNTDAIITSALAGRVEAGLPRDVMLLPTVSLGSSHHHLGFPGTLSLSHRTFTQVLVDLLESLFVSGFRRIVILNGHGGNHLPASTAIYEMKISGKTPEGAVVALATYWKIAADDLKHNSTLETPCLSHACEYETSMMLALRRELVCLEKATASVPRRESAFYDPMGYTPSPALIVETFRALSQTGALGSPELSTEEKGRWLLEVITASLLRFMKEIASGKLRV